MRSEWLVALQRIVASGQRGALATVVRVHGSTPQQAGARLVLMPDGSTVGTVGGGAIELAVLEALEQARATGESALLVKELGYDLGMCCGGRMEIFVERIEAAPRLFLCGAGHVAQATAAIARSIGFTVHVLDDREEQNSEARFPQCERELVDPPAALRRLTLSERDHVLIATHDHRLDEETLKVALAQRPRYIGVIGSKRKVFRLLDRIAQTRELGSLDNLYAPVGLDLGAVQPEEIAVSIAAELVALRRGHRATHLTAVRDPRLHKVLRGEPIARLDREHDGVEPTDGR